MCGICGVIGIEHPETLEAGVRRMMGSLGHRGPDDDGLLLAPPAGLGMRRLSIIDLPGGHQPIWNESGTLAVVFNGEIFNFRELRGELEARGHRFRTSSDTEVIVHSYETWGSDCVQHLRGMFAFAILEMTDGATWRAHRVFLARDRLGIKPLYYARAGAALLFASETRALLASGLLTARISPSAVASYLLFGSVGEPMTLNEGVASLPPGHCMLVPAADPAAARPEPYWDFTPARQRTTETQDNRGTNVAARTRALLEDSVRGHLIADVPLGVFLSSGFDSTALVALASRERSALHTFTVVFPEQDFSEATLARRTAESFGTRHEELLLGGKEMLARLDEAISAFDQPSMDGINTYFVSWAARHAGLKVALSGLGGDELFGGYATFATAPRLERLAAMARFLPPPLRAAVAPVVAVAGRRPGQPDAARKLSSAWSGSGDLPHPYFFTRALFTPRQARALFAGKQDSWDSSPWWTWLVGAAKQAAALDRFGAVSWLESRSYLVNTLLRDTDAMSMSQSLEVRVPFLDHPLVEFVMALPETAKRRGKIPKALLVAALADLLPAEIVAQPKRTFTFPWQEWLRGPLRDRMEASLTQLAPALQPVLDGKIVWSVWQDFLAGRTSWSRPWSLYVLNEWARRRLESVAGHKASDRSAATVSAA